MSGRSRPQKPQIKAAPRPPRRRERDKQPIPRNAPATNAALNWHVNELVVGLPKASRARKGGDNV